MKDILIKTLSSENGKYFKISDLNQCASRAEKNGYMESIYIDDKIASYVVYYINDERYFITMVWTDPIHRGKGLSKQIIKKIISQTDLPIDLIVHKNNPAYWLYRSLKFEEVFDRNDEVEMRRVKKIGIMQPYLFPYPGYFGLINSCDKILFYDDVNFIKKGWIHRQKILMNSEAYMFTIPVKQVSQNKLINEIELLDDERITSKILKTIETSYKKAPYFNKVFPIVESVLLSKHTMLDNLVISSIVDTCNYLDINIDWEKTSTTEGYTRGMERANRLIQITKNQGFSNYINVGPSELYTKEYFSERGVNLFFNKYNVKEYTQFNNQFVSHLSCIDLLMFNSKRICKEIILNYQIV
jgi:GNAT superfamily N-acetyltransferase